MAESHLHIVSFDIPSPPDYGGVIDVFYRLKALSEAGIKIHLHCFEYGRERSDVLNKYCESVYYYSRFKSPRYLMSSDPFIVETRKNAALLKNLSKDNYPILFEGLHTTGFLDHDQLHDRIKLVRAHNVEHAYYRKLAEAEKNPFRKLFFKTEANKLERYEAIFKFADGVLAISEKDQEHFQKLYGNSTLINPFHPFEKLETGGKSAYAFYHGNLSVAENKTALEYLLDQVFTKTQVPFVVAGKDAERAVKSIDPNIENLKVINSPSSEEMLNLAKNASLHVLPTFQDTGFKLKLLYSLFTAPVVIVNQKMVEGTSLAPFCEIAETPEAMALMIAKFHTVPIDKEKLKRRMAYLTTHFSNHENALKMKSLIRKIHHQ